MKCLVICAAAAVASGVALHAFADTSATYTMGGASPLADGKVTFERDGSGKITELRMKPDYGETLTLSGDELQFADGAVIVTSTKGKPVIANTISADGSLRLGGVTNMAWSGSVFDRYSNPNWVTVLTNTRLDDIVPVSSSSAGNANNSTLYRSCWIMRDRDTLRAEFQAIDGTNLKGVHLELKQAGDDIVGRVLNGGYTSSTNFLGASMFEHATFTSQTNNSTAKKYGFKQLTFGRRCDTFDYYGTLLTSDFDTVVATNVAIGDVELLYGANQSKPSQGWGMRVFEPRNITFAEGVLSAEFARYDSPNVKAVKVELKQFGDEIKARVKWARYATSDGIDFDFEADGAVYTTTKIATEDIYVSSGTLMYGIDTLCLRSKAKDRLMFSVSGTMDLDMPVSGENAEVTFEAASATAEVNVTAQNKMTASAYIIKGDADHVMKFYAQHSASPYYPLPAGMTDVYGEGTELHVYGYNKMGNGTSDGDAEITMHPGTMLYADNDKHAFKRSKQVVTLDAANFTANKTTYLPKDMTMANASTLFGTATLSAVYDIDQTLRVTGVGSGIFEANVKLYGNDVSRRWTIDVEDTVVDGVDFTMNGNITPDSSNNKAAIVKTGSGTMLMNGTMSYTVSPTEIVAGELRLGKSGATVADSSFSLQGGTLGLAAGTANTVGNVTLTASSAITVGNGATLTMASLTVPDGATLALTGDVLGKVKVSETLDADTLSRVTVNGKRAYQAADGYFRLRGLIISFH